MSRLVIAALVALTISLNACADVIDAADRAVDNVQAELSDCLESCDEVPCEGALGEVCGSDGMLYCNSCEIRCLDLDVEVPSACVGE